MQDLDGQVVHHILLVSKVTLNTFVVGRQNEEGVRYKYYEDELDDCDHTGNLPNLSIGKDKLQFVQV